MWIEIEIENVYLLCYSKMVLTKDRKKSTNYRSTDLYFHVVARVPSPNDPLPLISVHSMFRSELLSAEPNHPKQVVKCKRQAEKMKTERKREK